MADYSFALVVADVKCEKLTAGEPGDTDEIYFAVTAGTRIFRHPEFDISEGELKALNYRVWESAIADGQEMIFMFHVRETDLFNITQDPGAILSGEINVDQNVGDILFHVKRKGDSFEASFDRASSIAASRVGDNLFVLDGMGSSYSLTIQPQVKIGSRTVVIPVSG